MERKDSGAYVAASLLEDPENENMPTLPSEAQRTKRKRQAGFGLLTVAVAAVVCFAAFGSFGGSSNNTNSGSGDSTKRVGEGTPAPLLASQYLGVGGGDALLGAKDPVELIYSSSNGNVDPYTEVRRRFDSQFKTKFVNYINTLGYTDDNGAALHFTNAVILGFPPTPVPSSGHVTHKFMVQNGGLHTKEKSPIRFEINDAKYVPKMVDSSLFRQDSSGGASRTFKYSQSFTSTQTFQVTTGISTTIAEESTVTVKVPVVGSASSKLSTSLTASLSTSVTTSESKTTSWDSQVDFDIPAHSITNVTCFLSTGTLSSPFKGSVTPTPSSNVGWVFYDDRVYTGSTAWFWFFQTDQTIAGLEKWARYAGSSLNLDMQISGRYNAVAGSRVDCETHSCPYSAGVDRCYRP